MFDELLQTASTNIYTVRKIIQTNNSLRAIVFADQTIIQQEFGSSVQACARFGQHDRPDGGLNPPRIKSGVIFTHILAHACTEEPKKRFEHLSINQVIQGLFRSVADHKEYELISDAFLLHDQNLRSDVIEKLFADAGISNVWGWVKNHRKIKEFVEDIKEGQNTAEGKLNTAVPAVMRYSVF